MNTLIAIKEFMTNQLCFSQDGIAISWMFVSAVLASFIIKLLWVSCKKKKP